MEEIAPHDDGPHTYIFLKFPLFDSNGIPDRVCGISTDITGIKRTEERITSMAQILEESLNEIYIFDDQKIFAKKVLATYDNNTYTESFECHVLPEGEREERWLLYNSMPIKSGIYAGGRIEHYYDITERKHVEEKFVAYQTRLKHLSSALSLTEERERRHISEDLHDRIGQALTVMKMKLEELRNP